jgi:hypothetical protein
MKVAARPEGTAGCGGEAFAPRFMPRPNPYAHDGFVGLSH